MTLYERQNMHYWTANMTAKKKKIQKYKPIKKPQVKEDKK